MRQARGRRPRARENDSVGGLDGWILGGTDMRGVVIRRSPFDAKRAFGSSLTRAQPGNYMGLRDLAARATQHKLDRSMMILVDGVSSLSPPQACVATIG